MPTDERRQRRLEIVAAGARLAAAGLILPGEGNLSARVGGSRFLITPAGTDKGRLDAADLIELTVEGDETPSAASTELGMHRLLYRSHPDLGAVVHAHPPRVVAASLRGWTPDPDLLEEVREIVGPVGAVHTLAAGSDELAEAVADALSARCACVLLAHGAVATGPSVGVAVRRMVLLERLAEVSASS